MTPRLHVPPLQTADAPGSPHTAVPQVIVVVVVVMMVSRVMKGH